MKTKFICLPSGAVSVSYTDVLGVRVTREFICPIDGGYVREVGTGFGNGYTQVCRKLSTRGDTLMSTRASLLADIRREYKAMRREYKAI
jgi:hypothetical protein